MRLYGMLSGVFACLLAIMLVFSCGGTLSFEEFRALVDDFKDCTTSDECTVQAGSCGGQCYQVGINEQFLDELESLNCGNDPMECDYYYPTVALCRESKCTVVACTHTDEGFECPEE